MHCIESFPEASKTDNPRLFPAQTDSEKGTEGSSIDDRKISRALFPMPRRHMGECRIHWRNRAMPAFQDLSATELII